MPASSIHRLQLVQYALARAVVPSVRRYQHIKPTLHNLHWLPVNQRITYKIAALTFKILHYKEPSYLADLLHTHVPSQNLRSSDKHLLTIPYIKSSIGRRSFFFSAPTVCNSLPLCLRMSNSASSFLAQLKTYLFPA